MRKEDFPVLRKPLIYLDSAATTQKPQHVIDSISSFYENDYATVHRAIYTLAAQATELYNQARSSVARFINAGHEEIIFTKGTTESINLVASSFPFRQGDEIILSELEHHSNIVPWQMAAARHQLTLRVIPLLPTGDLDLGAFESLLSPRTRLVSLAWTANSIGTKHPLQEIIQLAHRKGALVFVDAAQAAAHETIDVKELGADFLAFSSHKCYGPTGIGILYGKKELLEELSPWQGGGDMIEKVSFERTSYNSLPLRLEAGTPAIAEAIGLTAALSYLQEIGLKNIQAHEEELTTYCLEKLRENPAIQIVGQSAKRGPIISFIPVKGHPLDLASWLDIRHICLRSGHLCAQPTLQKLGCSSLLRVSFGLYNSREDIDLFLAALQEGLKKLS